MSKLNKIFALLLAVVMIASCINCYVFAVEEHTIANADDTQYFAEGEEEQEGDLDIPIGPQKSVRRISLESLPDKLEYLKGEALDMTGAVVKAVYTDNTSNEVENYQVSGYDANVAGEQTITITYGTKIATFVVTVYEVGDVNGSGEVDGNDATLLLQHAAGWDVAIVEMAADVNGSGEVDGNDATLLLQYAAGWDVTLGGNTIKAISESAWLWMEKDQAEGYYNIAHIDFKTNYMEGIACYHEDECPDGFSGFGERIFNGEKYLCLGGTSGTFGGFDNETSTTITVYPYEGETCRIEFELVGTDSLVVTYIDEECADFIYHFKVGTTLTRLS